MAKKNDQKRVQNNSPKLEEKWEFDILGGKMKLKILCGTTVEWKKTWEDG